MPMALLPGHDGDAGGDRAHRAGDVVGEADDARGLDAGRRLELVERDDRAGADIDDLALHAEIVEHAFEQAARFPRARPAMTVVLRSAALGSASRPIGGSSKAGRRGVAAACGGARRCADRRGGGRGVFLVRPSSSSVTKPALAAVQAAPRSARAPGSGARPSERLAAAARRRNKRAFSARKPWVKAPSQAEGLQPKRRTRPRGPRPSAPHRPRIRDRTRSRWRRRAPRARTTPKISAEHDPAPAGDKIAERPARSIRSDGVAGHAAQPARAAASEARRHDAGGKARGEHDAERKSRNAHAQPRPSVRCVDQPPAPDRQRQHEQRSRRSAEQLHHADRRTPRRAGRADCAPARSVAWLMLGSCTGPAGERNHCKRRQEYDAGETAEFEQAPANDTSHQILGQPVHQTVRGGTHRFVRSFSRGIHGGGATPSRWWRDRRPGRAGYSRRPGGRFRCIQREVAARHDAQAGLAPKLVRGRSSPPALVGSSERKNPPAGRR